MTTRIMVVDDEPAIGKLLMYQLAGFGYQVSYVQDGLEALERLPAARPDLVILDVMMPLISGWEVCRQIRACSTVPIIMLTAKGADADIVTGLGAGADDYMTKPFSMAQLQARIEAVLRRAAPGATLRALARTAGRPDPHLQTDGGRRMEDGRSSVLRPPSSVHSDTTAAEETSLPPAPPAPADPAAPLRLGQHIRAARAAQGLTLHQAERAIKVRWEFLQAIEQENWSYMPRPVLRHALKAYAEYLGIDLPELIGRKSKPRPPLVQLHLAAMLALVMVLVVVGVYLL